MSDHVPTSTMALDHVDLISSLTNLYALLSQMDYLTPDQVVLPPHAGLPLKQLRDSGFRQDLIELISILPLLRDGEDTNNAELAFASQAVTYFDRGKFDLDFQRRCVYHGDESLPPFIHKLAQSERDFGPHVCYDVRDETIIEWNTNKPDEVQSWETAPRQPVSEYFRNWMSNFCELDWLPWRDEFGQNVLVRPKEYDRYLTDPTELEGRARLTAQMDATRTFDQLLDTHIEVSKAQRNEFWSKRLLYEEAGWPSNFDAIEFRRKCADYHTEWREVTDIRKHGPRAHYIEDMEHGRRLREWYKLKAGRHAV